MSRDLIPRVRREGYLPLLAETEAAQDSLQGQALQTAFVIGVGVATGSIAVSTYRRSQPRLEPITDSIVRHVVDPGRRRAHRRRKEQADRTDVFGTDG